MTDKFVRVTELLEEISAVEDHARERVLNISRQAVSLLPELSQDQLMKLATECDSEDGKNHCVYCAAWHIFVERENNANSG